MVPAGFAVVALVMVVYSAIADVTIVSLVFSATALVFVIVRFVVTYRSYLVVLGVTEEEATTDALTGLGDRRALTTDLDAVVASGADAKLLLYDLNGFKGYNDAFGHPAGDALLQRLGGCLQASVGDAGVAYRMGGDEFCVLLYAGAGEQIVSAASAALSESGEGFAISASLGRAALPADATTAAEALRTADHRMYQDKRSTRGAAGEQATHALLRVLTERHPDVGDHSHGVADLAEAVARRLGVADEQLREVRAGAALHDIGKAAIPDALLDQARTARRGRVGVHAPPHADRRAHRRKRTRPRIGGEARALVARALGRRRLPRRPRRRGDPARRPHHLRSATRSTRCSRTARTPLRSGSSRRSRS